MALRTLLGIRRRTKSRARSHPRVKDRRAWKYAGKDDGTRQWPATEFLSENHHHLYGRPWAVGRGYFDFLRESGLKPSDKVLDFGCGAGRVGIWLIPYLDEENYVGMDNHRYAIEAFRTYELALHDLSSKKPTILLDGSCEPHLLNRKFDVILDLWATRHFSQGDALRTYRSFILALAEGGRIITNAKPLLHESELTSLGLHVARRERRPNWQRDDDWYVLINTITPAPASTSDGQ